MSQTSIAQEHRPRGEAVCRAPHAKHNRRRGVRASGGFVASIIGLCVFAAQAFALGDDLLRGKSGGDRLRGQAGRDRLVGGFDADRLGGGAGSDTAVYSERTMALSLSIGDGPNDGAAGEHDWIASTVERARGGFSNDALSGDAKANVLLGGPGADAIDGGEGDDRLAGGAGDDLLDALDGPTYTDLLVCGEGLDTTRTDGADRVAGGCEG